jgi:hypothetical protein
MQARWQARRAAAAAAAATTAATVARAASQCSGFIAIGQVEDPGTDVPLDDLYICGGEAATDEGVR